METAKVLYSIVRARRLQIQEKGPPLQNPNSEASRVEESWINVTAKNKLRKLAFAPLQIHNPLWGFFYSLFKLFDCITQIINGDTFQFVFKNTTS